MNFDKIQIIAIYFFMATGGLWNYLGFFREVMIISAAPVMILLALVMINETALRSKERTKELVFLLFVFIITFVAEWSGVHNNFPFGEYNYTDILQPQLSSVPLAIGFAWISTLLGSLAIAERIKFVNKQSNYIKAIFVGLMMLVFDIVMEYSVLKLGYWEWSGGTIPVLNYISWFGLGTIISYITYYLKRLETKSKLAFHGYFAQLIYFSFVLIK